jgi:outer membrane protein assembly factor BamB
MTTIDKPKAERRSQLSTIRLSLLVALIALLVTIPTVAFQFPGSMVSAPKIGEATFTSLGNSSAANSSLSGSNGSIALNSLLTPSPAASSIDNWPTYEFAGNRSGSNTAEVTLSPSNASKLQVMWNVTLSGPVFGSPSEVNGTVYVGSWDGYEYALSASSGALRWKTFLGVENFTGKSYGCPWATPLGVTSAAAVYGGSVYVGSFYNYYSLNASTGAINWNYTTDSKKSVSDGYYSWSSPLFYNGKVYVGVSSQCDNPLIVGQVLELVATGGSAGTLLHSYYTIPGGGVGASVWSSPTLDARNNTVWITTGNDQTGNGCCGDSMIALNATTLAFQGAWTVPAGPPDSDFGAGASLVADSAGHNYAVATNKDGYAYALNRTKLGAGPVWQDQTTTFPGLSSCQPPGQSIAPAVFDGKYVYLGSSYTTINGSKVNGSVRSVYPSNGTYRWQTPTYGTVQGGLTAADGLIVDVSRLFTYQADPTRPGCYNFYNSPNSWLQVLNATSGHVLFSFHVPYIFAVAPAIADGRIFVGAGINDTSGWGSVPNHQGHVYAFGIPIGATASNLRPYDNSALGGNVYGFGNATGGMPNYNYTWTWGDGSGSSYGRDPSHIYYGTGHYTASVSIADAGGNSTTAWWAITNTIYGCGTGFGFCWITASTPCWTTLCAFNHWVIPQPVIFGGYVFGSVGGLSWLWSFGDGSTPSSAQYPVHSYASHGTYTVTVTVTDQDHHQATETIQVTV